MVVEITINSFKTTVPSSFVTMSLCPCFELNRHHENVVDPMNESGNLISPSLPRLKWPRETAQSIHKEFYRAISVAQSRGIAMSEKRHELVSHQKGFEDLIGEIKPSMKMNEINQNNPILDCISGSTSLISDNCDLNYGSTELPSEQQSLIGDSGGFLRTTGELYKGQRGGVADGVYKKLI